MIKKKDKITNHFDKILNLAMDIANKYKLDDEYQTLNQQTNGAKPHKKETHSPHESASTFIVKSEQP